MVDQPTGGDLLDKILPIISRISSKDKDPCTRDAVKKKMDEDKVQGSISLKRTALLLYILVTPLQKVEDKDWRQLIPDSQRLIPDSKRLIPDSKRLIPDSKREPTLRADRRPLTPEDQDEIKRHLRQSFGPTAKKKLLQHLRIAVKVIFEDNFSATVPKKEAEELFRTNFVPQWVQLLLESDSDSSTWFTKIYKDNKKLKRGSSTAGSAPPCPECNNRDAGSRHLDVSSGAIICHNCGCEIAQVVK